MTVGRSYAQETELTIMYYGAGSNSSEIDLLDDVQKIKRSKDSRAYEFIMLLDRIEGYSSDSKTLGTDFTDTKMYRVWNNQCVELDGKDVLPELEVKSTYEANMGDANLLKNFVVYCKTYFPAKKYMLILRSHGNGQNMCPDAEMTAKDALFPAEVKDVLGQEESVDILGLDVCSMAGLENLYEWRYSQENFSAEYVIASAPLSAAWPYDKILPRLNGLSLDFPNPERISSIVLEELKKHQSWASWGAFDTKQVATVKMLIDDLVPELTKEKKEVVKKTLDNSLHYYHNTSNDAELAELAFPYVDAYHFFEIISQSEQFSSETNKRAMSVLKALDALTMDSFYGNGFLPQTDVFEPGRNGAYIVAPVGDKVFSKSKQTFWSHTGWLHPDRLSMPDTYGGYDWCKDGANRNNGKVENFFEWLDFLYDEQTAQGGVNNYNY